MTQNEKDKTIIEAIRKYIGDLECIKTFKKAINVNFLGHRTESFSIETIPCNPLVKKYIDGSSVRQYQFIFCSKKPYGEEILQNIENSCFYEIFSKEIEKNNDNGILPILEKGLEAKSIEITSSAYAVKVSEDKAIFEINLNFKYNKGRC